MIRTAVLAAAAATLFALSSPGPAQAAVANPALGSAMPLAAEHVQYYYGPRRHHYRGYRAYRHHGYYPRRHRRCWNERVRVRVPGGYFVWRTHRRCGWR